MKEPCTNKNGVHWEKKLVIAFHVKIGKRKKHKKNFIN